MSTLGRDPGGAHSADTRHNTSFHEQGKGAAPAKAPAGARWTREGRGGEITVVSAGVPRSHWPPACADPSRRHT